MDVKVYTRDGTATDRTIALDDSVFGIDPNDHAIWLDVRRIQASARQGTHKAKERSEVRGSTRKLYRQKGTGHSRAGDAKSPIRRSGGTTFGPRPRNYRFKVNKKTSRLARRSALAYKTKEDALRIVESFDIDGMSTKSMVALMAGLDLSDSKVLILTSDHSPEVYRSSQNLRKVNVREAQKASTLDLLGAQVVILEEGAVEKLAGQLSEKEATAA